MHLHSVKDWQGITKRRFCAMARFFIEVPHEAKKEECARAAQIFLNTGSHFLTNADWGCLDGEHKAWIIVEVENKEEARFILPSVFRSQAKIVSLNKFTMEDIDELSRHHPG
jgi:hypothetical protein